MILPVLAIHTRSKFNKLFHNWPNKTSFTEKIWYLTNINQLPSVIQGSKQHFEYFINLTFFLDSGQEFQILHKYTKEMIKITLKISVA